MARLNTSAELWDAVSEVGYFNDTAGGSTTVDASSPADAPTLNVASETGYVAGEFGRVGSGETLEVFEVEAVAAGIITTKTNLAYTHAVNEVVEKQVKVIMGHISEGGVQANVAEDVFEISAATSALVLARRTTRVTQTISWASILFSLENLAVAFGIAETRVSGAGTAADPSVFRTIAADFNTLKNTSLYFLGALEDGSTFEIRGWNARYDLNKTSTFARNAVAEIPTGADVKTIEYLKFI